MPARRRKQSNAMLYTLITFVGLFIATTTIAVIYYVKAEEHRTEKADLQRQIDELVTSPDWRDRGAIVGAKGSGETYLGIMVDYLDETASLIVGGVPEQKSAEVKVNNVNTEVGKALGLAQEHIDIADPNNIGLVQAIGELTTKLQNTISAQLATQEQLNESEEKRTKADEANFEKDQILSAEKDKLQQEVEKRIEDYDQLEAFLEQSTDEQIKILVDQLQEAGDNFNALNAELLKTQALLTEAEDMMRRAQQEVMNIKPPPDSAVSAYKPDGKIILIDDKAQVVHLNIGSNERVYRGLTFTVYDRGTSVPKDGKGKAEIEVFDVAKTYSAARITRSEMRKPILQGDIVANLIWDSDKTNVFVITGDFDLDDDGTIDYNAIGKMTALIEQWGGRVADTVSVDTDYLVLGKQPQVLEKPTFEQLELDPRAMEKYEAALQRLNHYNDIQSQAQALWIPVFTYERFLYLVGYKAQIGRAGVF